MREFIHDGNVIARLITQQDIEDGLNFFSKDSDFLQVGAWRYEEGRELKAHIHNKVERVINRTHEALYIIKGSVEARLYSLEENLTETLTVNAGEMLVLLDCGHGYTILEDGTTVLEIKNGPYLGADKDRYRI